MKKTKKALLAVVACAATFAGAFGLAACNELGDGTTPGHTHSASWNTWTVTTKPTATEKGKATRTCENEGCDAADADKEYELPVLGSSDYTKGTDSATCAAGGKVTYTYNKDGVNVSFEVATPKTDNHTWGPWTVEEANKPTEEAGGKATRTCTVEGCTVAADEHTLPALDSEEYTTTADTATCVAGGSVTYTYNKDGVNVSFEVTTEKTNNHVWGAWTVEEANKPTAENPGKATRTCTVTGCTVAAQEHTLPPLDETNYTKTDDTATCVAGGTVTYTYNKDGVNVSFEVATPKTDNHTWGPWTVTKENEPTEAKDGKATRTCTVDGCTEVDEHVLPALNDTDYEKSADSATCKEGGTITYTYNQDGINKVFTVETPVNPAAHGTLEHHEAEFISCELGGNVEYWECPLCGKKFDAAEGGNELTDVTTPAGHNYVITVNKEDGTATETCTVPECGYVKTYKYMDDSISSTNISPNAVEAGDYYIEVENAAAATMWLQVELTEAAIYKLDFEHLVKTGQCVVNQVLLDKTNVLNRNGTVATSFVGVAVNEISSVDGVAQSSYFTINATEHVNKILKVQLSVKSQPKVKLSITTEKVPLKVGDNTVSITEANASADTSADKYEFVSATDKDYSITVPEGVTVLLNGEDLITSGTSANFTAKAGEPLVFTFIGDMGDYAATIGEPVIKPVLNVSTADKDNTYGVNITGKTVSIVEIGDVEAGKTYNIDVSGAFLSGRMMGQGCAQFKFNNGSDDFNAMFDANAQQLYYGSGENETNGCKITRTSQSITLTFTATSEKTYLYFSCSNKNVTGDLGVLTLKMTEAV